MSVCEQRIDRNGIYVRFANGYEFSLSRDSLKAFVQQEGTKLKALVALRRQLKDGLGSFMDLGDLDFDFRQADGEPTLLEWKAR